MRDAVRQGASGFISKALEPRGHLRAGAALVAAQPGHGAHIHKASGRSLEPAAKPSAEVLPLRQYEVLKMLAKGFSNKAIAKHFGLSEHTIRNQVASILKHLGADTRTQAVLVAQRNGILPATAIK
ncbi:response regulator transcription factor [Comamonas sp. JC664]|uniref:response regulator transcription factor n=1 Tax=Comamonas sp. JC664 TaxID=2801917 RepID=UPI0036183D04